jgi:hypothetical protein
MTKDEVKALVADKKVAAGVPFDEISAAIDSIEVGGDVTALLAQISVLQSEKADLVSQLSAAQASLSADEEKIAKAKADLG